MLLFNINREHTAHNHLESVVLKFRRKIMDVIKFTHACKNCEIVVGRRLDFIAVR
jgi:hypothetical protein